MSGSNENTRAIRQILQDHARLSVHAAELGENSNLYDAGLTSHASVTLMLALEEHFQVEFPERMLRRNTFATIAAIRTAVEELIGADV